MDTKFDLFNCKYNKTYDLCVMLLPGQWHLKKMISVILVYLGYNFDDFRGIENLQSNG